VVLLETGMLLYYHYMLFVCFVLLLLHNICDSILLLCVYLQMIRKLQKKKLGTEISIETKKNQEFLDQYNDVSCQLSVTHIAVALQEVLPPDSMFWTANTITLSDLGVYGVSHGIKNNIMQISERSGEEMEMLSNDMLSPLTYWKRRIQILSQATAQTTLTSDMYCRRMRCLLEKSKWHAEIVMTKAIDTFEGIIELPSDIKTLKASCGRTSFNNEASDSNIAMTIPCEYFYYCFSRAIMMYLYLLNF